VFSNDPTNLTATLAAFGNPGTSNAIRALYRGCLRSGKCIIAPFDNLRGQSFFQLDARVSKNFRIKERSNVGIFFQIFDLTNRANFGNNFGTDVRQTNFQKPTNFITPSGVIIPHAFSGELGVKFSF